MPPKPINPNPIIIFTTAFLATDYFFYKQEYRYVNSLVWRRVLGDSKNGKRGGGGGGGASGSNGDAPT